ncbi:MAG: ABC transporter permease [Nitrospiria bacterium]
MMLFKIAFRNIFRNVRRSLMTVSAIAVGAMAMLLFGEFISQIVLGLQTQVVEQGGHLAIFRNGYFNFGAGNPAAFGISNYKSVLEFIREDPELKKMSVIVTPTVNLFGIAGNFEGGASQTFFGQGVVPSDYRKMRLWDEYKLMNNVPRPDPGLSDEDESRGIIGVGVARILGLCEALKLTDKPDCPLQPKAAEAQTGSRPVRDFSALVERDHEVNFNETSRSLPRLDLLAGTASGAPNVVSFYVSRATPMGIRELDDRFIGLHINLAQQLLYGRGEHQAVSIVIQLHQTEDMAKARGRIENLIREKGLDLEVRDLLELQPFYKQVIGMFRSIFSFIATIMGVIVLFTVVNTMTMSVMERTNEIGTLRALGVRRRGIRVQFLVEGGLLGLIGSTAGLILSSIVAQLINHSGLTWLPPGQASSIPLRVLTTGNGVLMFMVWIGLGLLATVAAFIPANRAARMQVVDALGHV